MRWATCPHCDFRKSGDPVKWYHATKEEKKEERKNSREVWGSGELCSRLCMWFCRRAGTAWLRVNERWWHSRRQKFCFPARCVSCWAVPDRWDVCVEEGEERPFTDHTFHVSINIINLSVTVVCLREEGETWGPQHRGSFRDRPIWTKNNH